MGRDYAQGIPQHPLRLFLRYPPQPRFGGFFYDWFLARNDQFPALAPSRYSPSTYGERTMKLRLELVVKGKARDLRG